MRRRLRRLSSSDILKRTVASGPQNRGCPHWSRACCLPAANARIVISRAEILDAMWGVDYAAESKRRGAQDPQPGTAGGRPKLAQGARRREHGGWMIAPTRMARTLRHRRAESAQRWLHLFAWITRRYGP